MDLTVLHGFNMAEEKSDYDQYTHDSIIRIPDNYLKLKKGISLW